MRLYDMRLLYCYMITTFQHARTEAIECVGRLDELCLQLAVRFAGAANFFAIYWYVSDHDQLPKVRYNQKLEANKHIFF
jgi:hypothetical protein